MRDEFPNRVKSVLALRAAGRCSNPDCGAVTSGPELDPDGAVNVGVAAHITAASPGGPRYAPVLTSSQRATAPNGIWLCQRCAKLIDSDLSRYTVDVLRRWKTRAEHQAAAGLASGGGSVGDRPPGAMRARDTSWLHLGVHRPIQIGDADPGTLPAYVPRDIDGLPRTGLRAQVAAAAKHGGFVVLVGESSTGKTRSLFEAVTVLLGDRWLLHYSDLAERSVVQPPRLVLWLDNLQNHIGPGGLQADAVRRLTARGAVVLGTLWPHVHDQYATPPRLAFSADSTADPHRAARELLELATVIHMPRTPTRAENARAHEVSETANEGAGDARLKAALQVANYGFTQTIAAAPQLVDRWNNADPYARAVLTAAVDASRLGVRAPLPESFLQDAAPGYCSPAERAQAPMDWFAEAMAYSVRLLLGAVAPLTPVGADMTMGAIVGYQLADYLTQHADPERRMKAPPATFWDACIAHFIDSADLERLGNQAADRMRYRYAIPLLRRAGSRDSFTATRLAFLVGDQGHVDEAIAVMGRLADSGDPIAEYQLTGIRQRADEYRRLAKREIPTPAQKTRMLKALDGSRHVRLNTSLSKIPALVTEMFGNVDDLRRRYRADSSDINAAFRLTGRLACTGDFGETLPILHALIDRGAPEAGDQLAATLIELGRSKEAFQLARFGLSADGRIEAEPTPPGRP